jgi:RNA polymerase sigma-54 factor
MALLGTKQSLSQKLQQKLSPQQIQLMKLLQIPTATLEQRIKEELEANPALEEGDESLDLLDGMSELDLSERENAYSEKDDNDDAGGNDDDGDLSDSVLEDVERERTVSDEDYDEDNSSTKPGAKNGTATKKKR